VKQAAYVNEAGLDGLAWLKTTDRVESLATMAVAEEIHTRRAEARKKEEGK
jgi:hypothetical protein